MIIDMCIGYLVYIKISSVHSEKDLIPNNKKMFGAYMLYSMIIEPLCYMIIDICVSAILFVLRLVKIPSVYSEKDLIRIPIIKKI